MSGSSALVTVHWTFDRPQSSHWSHPPLVVIVYATSLQSVAKMVFSSPPVIEYLWREREGGCETVGEQQESGAAAASSTHQSIFRFPSPFLSTITRPLTASSMWKNDDPDHPQPSTATRRILCAAHPADRHGPHWSSSPSISGEASVVKVYFGATPAASGSASHAVIHLRLVSSTYSRYLSSQLPHPPLSEKS